MRVKFYILFVGFISAILMLLFIVIKYDYEFHEPQFFIKYRPTYKINFYSPIGESDATVNDLNDYDKVEELAYQDFVVENIGNRLDGDILGVILGQIVSTSLIFGLFYKKDFKIFKILIHYSMNIIFLFFGLMLIFHFNKSLMTFVIVIFLMVINIVIFRLINKKKQRLTHG